MLRLANTSNMMPKCCTCGSKEGSYLRLIDFCTHLNAECVGGRKAQGPSRTCNESNEEEEGKHRAVDDAGDGRDALALFGVVHRAQPWRSGFGVWGLGFGV